MRKFTKNNEAQLLELLREELDAWEQIQDLTTNQAKLLEADDIDALDKSIDARQGLIEKINGLHQESNILMQLYISAAGEKDSVKSAPLEMTKTKLREKIAVCARLNESNLATASKMKGGYLGKAEELGQKRKSIGAYASGVTNNSELFDKKM